MRLILALIILPLLAMAQKGRPQRVVVCTGAGSATAATCTPSPAISALSDLSTTPRTLVSFTPTANSTGAMTLAINGLTATALRKYVGGAAQAIAADDLRASTSYMLEYDGTYFIVKSVLGNGGSGGGSGDVTAAANIADNRVTRGDGGTKGIQQSGCTLDDSDNLTCPGSISTGDGSTTGYLESLKGTAPGTPATGKYRLYWDGSGNFSDKDDAGAVRTYASLTGTQTLTNKTLTSPVLSNGTNGHCVQKNASTGVLETSGAACGSGGGGSLTWRTKTVNRAYIGGGQTEAPLVATNMTHAYGGSDSTGTIAALTAPEATDKVLVWNTFIPDGYTSGTLTLTVTGWATSATGNIRLEASTNCPSGSPPAAAGSPITFNTATGGTFAGTQSLTEWAISGIAMTGCAAGEEISIKLVRLRSDALDTSTADVFLSSLKAAL